MHFGEAERTDRNTHLRMPELTCRVGKKRCAESGGTAAEMTDWMRGFFDTRPLGAAQIDEETRGRFDSAQHDGRKGKGDVSTSST